MDRGQKDRGLRSREKPKIPFFTEAWKEAWERGLLQRPKWRPSYNRGRNGGLATGLERGLLQRPEWRPSYNRDRNGGLATGLERDLCRGQNGGLATTEAGMEA